MMLFNTISLFSLILFLDGNIFASAQDPVCACNPTTYAFTVDFDNDCSDFVYDKTGIDSVACSITATNSGRLLTKRDFTIQTITTLFFAELGPGPGIFRNTQERNNVNIVVPGEEVLFPSLIDPDLGFTDVPIPFGIKLTVFATTTVGATVRMDVEIRFTNVCEKQPIFTAGNVFAWLVYDEVNAGSFVPEFCALPSQAPSLSLVPSRTPTAAPTRFKSSKSSKSSKSRQIHKSKGKGQSPKAKSQKGKGKGKGFSTKSPVLNLTQISKGGKSQSSKSYKSKQYKR